MNRIKTYLSDGTNPNGRLFANDVNSLQDAVAAITDLTQHISTGDLAIGESSLLLSRFGVGQAQLAGLLRVAAGLLPGVFTTTQRDAIVSGKRPTGLVIFNSTTNRLEVNAGTDPSPSWLPVGAQAPSLATSLPGSPTDGQELYLTDSLTVPTWSWHMRYVSAIAKWVFVGGSARSILSDASTTDAQDTSDADWGASVTTFPFAGDWDIRASGGYTATAGANAPAARIMLAIAGAVVTTITSVGGNISNLTQPFVIDFKKLGATAGQSLGLKTRYLGYNGSNGNAAYSNVDFFITPRAIS